MTNLTVEQHQSLGGLVTLYASLPRAERKKRICATLENMFPEDIKARDAGSNLLNEWIKRELARGPRISFKPDIRL